MLVQLVGHGGTSGTELVSTVEGEGFRQVRGKAESQRVQPRPIHLRRREGSRGKESRGKLGRHSVPVSLWSREMRIGGADEDHEVDTKTDTKRVKKGYVGLSRLSLISQ